MLFLARSFRTTNGWPRSQRGVGSRFRTTGTSGTTLSPNGRSWKTEGAFSCSGGIPPSEVPGRDEVTGGTTLLKKTGAGNLFMVFGEPDMEIRTKGDGKVVVEIRGVDVYDPTTGVIRSSTTDDIACWFLDTNYDEESFFVRHAYFTGAGDPYEKLKRALRAEVDEAAWAILYSTVSRPFDPPQTGKIAAKVINHYGDEVLKVFEVSGAGTSAAAARSRA